MMKNEPVRFSVEQLLNSKMFREQRDLIHAILDPDETYTAKEAQEKIEEYLKGKVK